MILQAQHVSKKQSQSGSGMSGFIRIPSCDVPARRRRQETQLGVASWTPPNPISCRSKQSFWEGLIPQMNASQYMCLENRFHSGNVRVEKIADDVSSETSETLNVHFGTHGCDFHQQL